ncbi:Uncharacterised protein [Bordetella pertussis]|nr:Uncharacterised protein [Bordetella pertussis]
MPALLARDWLQVDTRLLRAQAERQAGAVGRRLAACAPSGGACVRSRLPGACATPGRTGCGPGPIWHRPMAPCCGGNLDARPSGRVGLDLAAPAARRGCGGAGGADPDVRRAGRGTRISRPAGHRRLARAFRDASRRAARSHRAAGSGGAGGRGRRLHPYDQPGAAIRWGRGRCGAAVLAARPAEPTAVGRRAAAAACAPAPGCCYP